MYKRSVNSKKKGEKRERKNEQNRENFKDCTEHGKKANKIVNTFETNVNTINNRLTHIQSRNVLVALLVNEMSSECKK